MVDLFARGILRGPFPPEVPEMGRFGEEERSTFTLTKLHGSTHWFGHDGGTDVYSVVRADALVPNWGADVEVFGQARWR